MIQILIFLVLLFLLIFVWGKLAQFFLPIASLPELLVSGFVFLIAIFQLATTPIMAYHAPFRSAQIVFWLMTISGLIILAVISRKYPNRFEKFSPKFSGSRLVFWLAVLTVLIQASICAIFYFENPDDSFYVSTVLTNIDTPAIYAFDPSTGDPAFPMMAQYRFESWELLQAVLAKSFSLSPAVLAHTALPYMLVILAYLAYSILAREILPANQTVGFILALSFFYMLGGYSDYSAGTFLLTRIWQGKSVLLHIAIPYLLAVLLQWIKSGYSPRYLIKITAILIFGIALNPIAIFLLPLAIFPIAAIELFRNFRRWRQILPVAICILPLAFYAIAIRSGIQSSVVNRFPVEEFSLSITLQRFLGSGFGFFLLYVVGLVVGWKKMDNLARVILAIAPLIYLLTIWNPLFTHIIAKYITSYPTYWRLYWLFPLAIGLAYQTVFFWHSNRNFSWIFTAAIVLIGLTNQSLVWDQLVLPEHPAKIPAEHIELADHISTSYADAYVIAPEELAITLRQITPAVRLFWSRQNYMQEFLDTGKKNNPFQQRLMLEAMYSFNEDLTEEQIQTEIRRYQIEIIIAPKTGHLHEKLSKFEPIYSSSNYVIYRIDQ